VVNRAGILPQRECRRLIRGCRVHALDAIPWLNLTSLNHFLPMSRLSKSEREAKKEEAITKLRELLPEGSTISLSLSHVSRSGMSRVIKCIADDRDISYFVANATENPWVDGYIGGVRIGGCGMDMGFTLIDQLAHVLYGKPLRQSSNKEESIGHRWL